MLFTMGLSGTPSLCTFGNPYNLCDLEPDGSSCLLISSVSEEFLSSRAGFLSVFLVGSLSSLLYDVSSRS
jgi:hypothetical protein